MQLRTFSIGRKAIVFDVTLNPNPDSEVDATEERRITAHEAPLITLTNSFAALGAVFCAIMEVPADYSTGLSITKITVTTTKGGTRSIKLRGKKQLDTRTGLLHPIDTPFVQIDKPADGESGEIQLDKKLVTLVCKALKEAEGYASGKRSQQLLNLDEDKEALNAQFKDPSLI